MKVQVITLFPDLVEAPLSKSILGAAQAKGLLELRTVQLRDYCTDRHRTADDAPFGGGGGMVMKAQPVIDAVAACKARDPQARMIHLSPQGRRLDHAKVLELAEQPGLILLCGHYEGIDQRALDATVDEELSLGDFVLTGGELAAAVLIDALARHLPGVLGCGDSAANDSFSDGLLDFPHYTRPASHPSGEVPAVLLSGDHQAVARWRRQQALKATLEKRPDLLKTARLDAQDLKTLAELGYPVRPKAATAAKPKKKGKQP